MNQDAWDQIVRRFCELPDGCRNSLATESEIEAFEVEFGPIPIEYRRFLMEVGGGAIGSEWVDGIAELAATHRKFREETNKPNGWVMKGVFIIGWDGAGNPFGIDEVSGRILVEDHDFGGVHVMSGSFEDFLLCGLT